MFANLAIAFLISLGIALTLFFVAKGVYSRFSPQALHMLVAILAITGSTVAGTVALSSSKAYNYVVSLEEGARNLTGQADALQSQYGLTPYGISASGVLDGYVKGTAATAKRKLARTRTLSLVIMAVLNLLLLLFLLNAGSKAASRSCALYSSTDDDLDDLGSPSSFDLDLN